MVYLLHYKGDSHFARDCHLRSDHMDFKLTIFSDYI
jgi:hypothetical protein